ncbi:AimR family lysis-lysogeny pheromone receptor [Niallia taxi]|uniref:AimR family lysis-lysogeny pheromone receptor n=1 Tax=Niallia taxi TaxID=2499688 RepID=UPI0031708432
MGVRAEALQILKDNRGLATIIAEKAGYSTSGAFNKILKRNNFQTENFDGFVIGMKLIYPDNFLVKMEELVEECNPQNLTSRCMLEYLSVNRLTEGFLKLINKMENCNNAESREWSKFYKFIYENQTSEKLDYNDFLKRVEDEKTSVDELIILQNLLKIYSYHQKKTYKSIKDIVEETEIAIDKLENEFIKKSYLARLSEPLAYISLWVNSDEESCRKYANNVLNSEMGLGYKGSAYYQIGYSYMFSSYEKAISYLNKSMDIYTSLGRAAVVEDIEEKIELITIHWNKNNFSECRYIQNQLYLETKRNSTENLVSLRDQIDEPFYYYLLGLKNGYNEMALLKSMVKYLKRGDSFLANLPKSVLLKNDYDEEFLMDLVSLKIA